MKKATVITTLSILAAFGAGIANAGTGGDKMKRFEEADTNKDGVVSHDEMMAGVKVRFAEFDKNGDGFIELSELPKEMPVPEHMQERMDKHLERMKEKGKEISPEKLERMQNHKPSRIKFLSRHDKDGDEKISVEEFSSRMVKHFKHADANGDGNVTKEEIESMEHARGKKHGKRGGMHGGDRDHHKGGRR